MSIPVENARLKKNKNGEETHMLAAASINTCFPKYGSETDLRYRQATQVDSGRTGSQDQYETEGCGIGVVDDCIKYIDKNLHEKITLEDLAMLCGRDKFQVIRTFRRALGTTPHAYIVEARVFRAAELLKSGEPAAEVASEVGFVDQSHLIRYFKRHVGTTPKRFVYER